MQSHKYRPNLTVIVDYIVYNSNIITVIGCAATKSREKIARRVHILRYLYSRAYLTPRSSTPPTNAFVSRRTHPASSQRRFYL